jgi:hypothetical protein
MAADFMMVLRAGIFLWGRTRITGVYITRAAVPMAEFLTSIYRRTRMEDARPEPRGPRPESQPLFLQLGPDLIILSILYIHVKYVRMCGGKRPMFPAPLVPR